MPDETWVVARGGKVCIQVYDTKKERFVYIPERKWLKMPESEKVGRYV